MGTTIHWIVQSTVDHHTASITMWDMAVFKVAELDNAALQCTALCVCCGNFEHYISVNWWLFLKLVMLNNWKSFEKGHISLYTDYCTYCQLSWLNVTLKMYSLIYMIKVILSSWSRWQVTKNKRMLLTRAQNIQFMCTWMLKREIFLSIFTFEHILCLLWSLIYPAVYLLLKDLCVISLCRYST